jgi:hypothetical protein
MMGCFSEKTLAKELWGTALEAIGTTEIDPACENFLRGWIAIGIQRMIRQDRISATDLTLAQVNLRTLVELMKIEASYLSTRRRLDTSTIKATRKKASDACSNDCIRALAFVAAQFRGIIGQGSSEGSILRRKNEEASNEYRCRYVAGIGFSGSE